MVVDDFDPEVMKSGTANKIRLDRGSIRPDAEEIMNGREECLPLSYSSKKTNRPISQYPAFTNLAVVFASTIARFWRQSGFSSAWQRYSNRRSKFIDCLSKEDLNICKSLLLLWNLTPSDGVPSADLRKLAWSGTPSDLRPIVWPILLVRALLPDYWSTDVFPKGYIPLPSNLRASTLARKRGEYLSLVELAFARDRQGVDQQIWHQIEIDVPRTRPGVRLWMQASTQRSLERILYVWAIRHPASGYVFPVLNSKQFKTDSDPEQFDTSLLPENILNAIEADSFWCLSRLLDGIQDNYISAATRHTP
ncbi:rab-GTPase-TBC domain-containing protein [Chiua virens]|nr:rab-GTPase-TBC domain-containing protein [Chiua virens]